MSYSERQTLHNVIWISRCKYVYECICVCVSRHMYIVHIKCIIYYHYHIWSQSNVKRRYLRYNQIYQTNDWYGFHLKIGQWGYWGYGPVIWHLMINYNISNRQSIRLNASRINACTSMVRVLQVNILKQGLSHIMIILYIIVCAL